MSPTLLLNLHQLHKKVAEILERSKGTLSLKGIWFANIDMLVTSDPANVHNNNKKLLEFPNDPTESKQYSGKYA